MHIKYIKHTYSNSLRLILAPQKESPSVTVAVLVEAGSAYEDKKNNGISHFLEHMCFKGTKKRPTSMEISSALEGLGASYNAFTSRDMTGYYAKVAYPNFEKILDIISDMYLNPLFDEKEIEKEKGVIIEEINMYEDQPRSKASQKLEEVMYGDQPAGWDVAGLKENIRKIKKSDFIEYRNKHYHASKTIVVISGNINILTAKKLVSQYFREISKNKIIKSIKVKENQTKPKVILTNKKIDQSHLAIGVKSFSVSSQNKYPLMLLADILGGGMSSRLFHKIREQLGLAYYVGSSLSLFVTHGYLEIYAGVNNAMLNKALEAIIKEIKLILEKGVSDEELKRVKDHRIGTFLLSLETSSDLAFYFAEQEANLGQIETPKQVIQKIKSVTKEDVHRLAKRVFNNHSINLSIVGPRQKEKEIQKIFSL